MRTIPSLYRAAALAMLLSAEPASAELIHRYSFTSNANDSVGTAHGESVATAAGSPPAFVDGKAMLDGAGGYIDLPNSLFSTLTSTTIEAWVTVDANANWSRIFDFGTSNIGEAAPDQVVGTPGMNYMFLTPNGANSGMARFAITDAANGGERPILNDSEQFPVGEEVHVAVVYGPPVARLYVNSRLAASGAAVVPLSALIDNNNWLGRSQWPDPMFAGSYNEFRIHNSLLGGPEIGASAKAGPEAVNYDPGAVTAITLLVEQGAMIVGQLQAPRVKATFSSLGEVDLGAGEFTLTSSSANVLRVTPAGELQGAGVGTATVTASRGGQSSSISVTVNPAAPAVLKHRYSFSDSPASATVADSVGNASGTIQPPEPSATVPSPAPVVLTNGQAFFPAGVTWDSAGYIDLPDGIISRLTNVTIETWVTWSGPNNNANQNWSRIFDFGNSTKGEDAHSPGNGSAQGYLFLTPRANGNTIRFAAEPSGGAENPVLNFSPTISPGQETHLAVIYAPEIHSSRLYINGNLAVSGGAPFALTELNDANNWLGASQWQGDQPYRGFINEFRIYEGPLTDLEVALSRSAGPDVLAPAPGALQSIAFAPLPALWIGDPSATPASLLANFQNTTNVNVTTVAGAMLASSDTNIFTVSATGGLRPRNVGAASLTASFQGLSASSPVTVAAPTALTVATTNLIAEGAPFAAVLTADFPGVTGVNVNGFSGITRSSSNPNVATITANGAIVPLTPGTTTITSTYGGLTNQIQFTVAPAAYPRGQLIHRYSFDGAVGSTAVTDSIGAAHGSVVFGSGANDFNGAGQLALAGGGWNAGVGGYVNLPNRLVSTLSSVTLEGWATWTGGPANQRFFDFGMSSGAADADGPGTFGEDAVANPGRSYLFLTPSGPRFAIKEGTGPEIPSVTSSIPIAQNTNIHYAVVYDPPNGVTRLYINGQRAGTSVAILPLSVVDDRNNWLGRSVWQDPMFQGLFDEFRIYNGPLFDADIAASHAAGPNNLPDLPPPPRQQPSLIARIAGGNIEMTWPASATGFVLETTSALGAAWTPVSGAPTQEGANLKATIPAGGAHAFYRLRRP